MPWHNIAECKWQIDENGCLEIAPTNGQSGTLDNSFPGKSESSKTRGATLPAHSYVSKIPHNFPWLNENYKIKSAKIAPGVKAAGSLAGMFSCCNSLVSLDLSSLDTSNVTDMSDMFDDCHSLVSLYLPQLDASDHADRSLMFRNCRALVSLVLPSFNVSNWVHAKGIFCGCGNSLFLQKYSGILPDDKELYSYVDDEQFNNFDDGYCSDTYYCDVDFSWY